MSTTSISAQLGINATEVLSTTEAPLAADETDRTLRVKGQDVISLSSTTTPSVEAGPVVKTVTIAGGEATIDLTAAPQQASRTVDLSAATRKLVALQLVAPSDNSALINVKPHGTNGYNLFGSGNEFDLQPGMTVTFAIEGVASGLEAVDSTHKIIHFTGTNDDTCDVILIFGNVPA